MDFCLLTFSNLHNLFYNSSGKPSSVQNLANYFDDEFSLKLIDITLFDFSHL